MITDLAISAACLFTAVMLAYFYARSLPASPNLSAEIQSFAFSAWMMGHIILAFLMRSEKEPLYVLGPLSNKVIDLWAVLAFSFLFIAIAIPTVSTQLRLTALTSGQLVLVFAFAFLPIFWQEIVKLLRFKPNPELKRTQGVSAL